MSSAGVSITDDENNEIGNKMSVEINKNARNINVKCKKLLHKFCAKISGICT